MNALNFFPIGETIIKEMLKENEPESFIKEVRFGIQELAMNESFITKNKVRNYLMSCGVTKQGINNILNCWPDFKAEEFYSDQTESSQISLFPLYNSDPGDEHH